MTLSVWMAAGLAAAAAAAGERAIRWPAHEAPVLTNVDVLVVGGASAGVAAAVEAARQGATVFLTTPHPYLGDDICATLRLWLDLPPTPPPPLVETMFAGPPDRPDGARLPLTYTADTPSDPRHRDSEPPRRLADGKISDAAQESVQYNGPVTLVADLGERRPIARAGVWAFQRPSDFVVGEIDISFSDDGRLWSDPMRARNADASLHAEETPIPIRADVNVTQRFVRI